MYLISSSRRSQSRVLTLNMRVATILWLSRRAYTHNVFRISGRLICTILKGHDCSVCDGWDAMPFIPGNAQVTYWLHCRRCDSRVAVATCTNVYMHKSFRIWILLFCQYKVSRLQRARRPRDKISHFWQQRWWMRIRAHNLHVATVWSLSRRVCTHK